MTARSRLAMPCGVACLLLMPALIPAQDVEKKAIRPAPTELPVLKVPPRTVEQIKKDLEALIRLPDAPPRPVPAAPPVELNRAIRVQANIDGIARQQSVQIRPILRSEYQFFVAACEPTKAHRKAIARAGESALEEVSKKVAEWRMGRRPAGQLSAPEPRTLIQDALIAAAKAHLSPEQVARYREERDSRAAGLKRAVLRNLVAKLDQSLLLSAEQREAIGSALDASWEPGWSTSINMFVNDNQFFFPIPDRVILPTLTDAQKKVWSGLQKLQGISWTQDPVGFGGAADNAPLEDAEIDEPRGPKPAPFPAPAIR